MYKYYWYETLLPKSVCDEICNILKQSDTELKEAEVVGQEASHVRKSVNHWVPDSSWICLLYTSPSPRDGLLSRMPSSA